MRDTWLHFKPGDKVIVSGYGVEYWERIQNENGYLTIEYVRSNCPETCDFPCDKGYCKFIESIDDIEMCCGQNDVILTLSKYKLPLRKPKLFKLSNNE